jgi:electron transfer flavoprotein alpha subunit
MGTLSLVIKTSKDTGEFKKSGQGNNNLNKVQNLIKGMELGSDRGSVASHGSSSDPAYATGTVTLVSAVATNTVTIGKTVFTFTSTPTSNTATAVDVEVVGASDTADAAALAAAINANALGAATACSRPVADIGWRPHHEHVGQTGVAIRPNLYIAAGISGAIQHLAGVNGSKVIVVINTDAEAPFFKAADYGIVGDAFEILPRFTEAVKKFKAAQH